MTEQDDVLDELAALRMLIENSTDMLSRHTPTGTYRYVSPASRELLGYEPEELLGRSAYDLFHPDDLAAISANHGEVLEQPDLRTIVYRIRHRAGHYVWFETTSHAVRDPGSGEIVEIQTSSRDVTRRVETETRLRRSEQQFRLAMEHAPTGMALVGLDGSFLEVNDQLGNVVGRTAAELRALRFQDITHPDDLDADLAYVQQLLEGEIDRYSMAKRYIHADGRMIWVLLSGSLVRDADGAPHHFVAQIQDITQQIVQEERLRAANEALERLVNEDLLTGLATRRAVLRGLDSELTRDDRHGRGVAVMLADVDRFKRVNDRHGHAEGDRVLRDIASAVSGAVREVDLVGRFGGEEVLVVLPEVAEPAALSIAERVRAHICSSVSSPDGPVTVSIGVAVRRPAESAEQLIARADQALYRAKRAGRNNVQGQHPAQA
ncbi:MAG TPA: PAS domain S-box protein [Acidimicrobiales bacterium]|nr:PAS domain S-box protein [Acidimicrobiales bacterium]